MGNEPVLIPDYTFFIQFVLFFASYLVMRRFLFAPYLSLLKLRHDRTVKLRESAALADEKARKLQEHYQTYMSTERKKLSSWLDSQRALIAEQQRRDIDVVREGANQLLHKNRSAIDANVAITREQLASKTKEYASLIASKILGRAVRVDGVSVLEPLTTHRDVTVPQR